MDKKPVIRHYGSDFSLSVGFLICMILTLTAYGMVTLHWFASSQLVAIILVLAFVQFFVQMFLFLHLGRESKPRWKSGMFLVMVSIVFLVVAGSLWIMHHLDYNMMNMSPDQKNVYMSHNEGL